MLITAWYHTGEPILMLKMTYIYLITWLPPFLIKRTAGGQEIFFTKSSKNLYAACILNVFIPTDACLYADVRSQLTGQKPQRL